MLPASTPAVTAIAPPFISNPATPAPPATPTSAARSPAGTLLPLLKAQLTTGAGMNAPAVARNVVRALYTSPRNAGSLTPSSRAASR